VNLYDAKTHLSALVDRAAEGEEIVMPSPAARSFAWCRWPRVRGDAGGFLRGKVRVARDFDAPLAPEILFGTGGRSR